MKTLINKINKETALFVVVVIFSVLLRKSMIYYRFTSDYGLFKNWYDYILDHGGILALSDNFSNYPPLYLLFLIAGAYIFGDTGYKPYGIKGFPILFDFVSAFFVYKILREKFKDGPIAYIGTSVFLLTPTMFINSSYWGQNDSMYLVGMLACVYFLMRSTASESDAPRRITGNEIAAFVSLGLAIAIKLQAIFLAPLLLILLFKKVSWKSFFIVPLVYLVTILPAWLIGRPLQELLTLYVYQVNMFRDKLSMSAPSIYAWLPGEEYGFLIPWATLLALIILLSLSLLAWKKLSSMGRDQILALAFLSVLIAPFVLPKMHERYFYPADAFAILFGFYFPQFFYVPIIMISVSLFSFFPYLYGYPIAPIPYLTTILLVMIIYLLRNWQSFLGADDENPALQKS
jgi:Gpi18-like mannosyltransferase